MFSASIIEKATGLRAPFVQCTKQFHNVSLVDLHGTRSTCSRTCSPCHAVDISRLFASTHDLHWQLK